MYKKSDLLFFEVKTPLHAGSGNDLGVIDLPIQRERHTEYPKIEGSSLKGALREAFENIQIIEDPDPDRLSYHQSLHLLFGYDADAPAAKEVQTLLGDRTQYSGSLAVSDARILFFPIRSMKGVYAFATCPAVLKRFRSDIGLTGRELPELNFNSQPTAYVTDTCSLHVSDNTVFLEEYAYDTVTIVDETMIGALEDYLSIFSIIDLNEKLIIIPDDDFRDFVVLSTEVITRTKIDNLLGTVKKGALFNEEYLPENSILYSIVMASTIFHYPEIKQKFCGDDPDEANAVMEFFRNKLPAYFQIGGNMTIGKGICQTSWLGGNNAD